MAPATATATGTAFGTELRRWRRTRRHSQLELSVVAEVSQRHLSHLETGRSSPSRTMVLRLAEALELPLRARNELLGAAGYTPAYEQAALDDVERAALRRVLTGVLDAHLPSPAYVVDRHWRFVLANDATAGLLSLLPDPVAASEAADGNVLRLLLHPDGLRPHVVNLGEVAAVLLGRLRREVVEHGGDEALTAMLGEMEELAGPVLDSGPPSVRDLAVPLHVRLGEVELRLVTMIATIGAAHDVTVEELRIETLLPVDDATRETLAALRESRTADEAGASGGDRRAAGAS